MSDGLSAIERRALRRRQRLEQNAGKRLETIFIGTGLPTPPVEEALPAVVTGEEIVKPKPKLQPQSSPEEKIDDKKTQIPQPPLNTEKVSQTSAPKPKTRGNANLQLKKDAIESMNRARATAQNISNPIDYFIKARVAIAVMCSILFVAFGYDQSVLITVLTLDLSIVIYYAFNPPKSETVVFSLFSKLHRITTIFQLVLSMVKIFSVFMFFTVISSAITQIIIQ